MGTIAAGGGWRPTSGCFRCATFSEAIMKAILSAALVLGLCGLARAEDKKADPVGTWKCEYKIGDMKRMSTLTIKKDGDKLKGKGAAEFGGQKQEFDIEGKREKKDK